MSKDRWLAWTGYIEQARTFALIVAVVTIPMPFSIAINGGATITMLAFSLALLGLRHTLGLPRPPARYAVPVLMMALFLLYALSIAWEVFPATHRQVDRRLALGAFSTLIFFASPTARERDLALFWFTVAVTLLGIVGEVIATKLYIEQGQSYLFVGSSLTHPFHLHRVYVSVHALFALMALTLAGKEWAGGIWRRLWQGGLVLFVLLLSSRNTTLAMLLLAGLYLGQAALRGRGKAAAYGAAGLAAALGVALALPPVRSILSNLRFWRTNWGTPATVDPYDGWQMRHFIWQAARRVIEATPWYGRGGGSAPFLLVEDYKATGFDYALREMLNAHNQYLEMRIDLGYPGLLLLVALLAVGFVQGLRGNRLALGLFLLSALILVTECYLEAQKGIVFLSFAWALVGSAKSEKSPSHI